MDEMGSAPADAQTRGATTMRLRVKCDSPDCDQWADLGWDDEMYWTVSTGDIEDETSPAIYLDKVLPLPAGWGPDNYLQGQKICCPKHAYHD